MFRITVAIITVAALFVMSLNAQEEHHQCDYPCPATFVAAPRCARNKHTSNYHTFRTDCVLFCYNKLHPDNNYVAVGTPLKTCTQLGFEEEPRDKPFDEISEFDL